MRGGPCAGRLMAVSTAVPNRLTLELVLVDELPQGQVVTAAGRAFPFSGWLGLAAAIEGATGSHTTPQPSENPHHA
jgi:hypothetical protein